VVSLIWSADCIAATPTEVVGAVVGIHARIAPDARTATTLGRERWGSGVVIDNGGLVLTIGYLILEASSIEILTQGGSTTPADAVAYDQESGIGLIRALSPIAATPAVFGTSTELKVGDPALVLSYVGKLGGQQVEIVDRRDYAGYWEYILENAVFTQPPHDSFGGAALIDTGGRLIGIGSLQVPDAAGENIASAGNMFVPIDVVTPVLGDLLATGRRASPPRPWLGIYLRKEQGLLVVAGVAEAGPAARAGLVGGELILGVAGQAVGTLTELYRAIWSLGDAGVVVPLRVRKGNEATTIEVISGDRNRWLKWPSPF
jgi:S1-C subfamily serine protease